MPKQIARLLKTDVMADLDMPGLAQLLAAQGRKGDTMLAHITPKEAALLRAEGGAGTINPDTGLMEFYYGGSSSGGYDPDNYFSPRREQTASVPMPKISSMNSSEFNAPAGSMRNAFDRASTDQLAQAYINSLPPDQRNPPAAAAAPPAATDLDVAESNILRQQRGQGLNLGYVGLRPPAEFGGRQAPFGSATATIPELTPAQQIRTMPGAFAPLPAETEATIRGEPSFAQRLKANLTSPQTLEKLGLAGLQALPGILASRQAAAQGRQAREEMQRMAAPYQQQGQQLVAQAQRGELTAPAQQQIQALQAQAAQGAAGRGGVGAEQAAAQVEAFRQQLLQSQYDMGLKVANIGDQIAAGAIRTGLSADQYVNELTNNYFTNIARMSYGQAPQVAQPQTQVVR